jgi:Uma2 family endonuclease
LRRGTEIVVQSGKSETRYPDLMVISEETRLALKKQRTRSIILPQMPPPLLVLEMVSPGDESSQNYKRGYQEKPVEYASIGIPEYWIIDPQRSIVWVGILMDGAYQFQAFQGLDLIESPIVPDLKLTVSKLFGLDD